MKKLKIVVQFMKTFKNSLRPDLVNFYYILIQINSYEIQNNSCEITCLIFEPVKLFEYACRLIDKPTIKINT